MVAKGEGRIDIPTGPDSGILFLRMARQDPLGESIPGSLTWKVTLLDGDVVGRKLTRYEGDPVREF